MKPTESFSGTKNHSNRCRGTNESGPEVEEGLCVEGGSICYIYLKERANPIFSFRLPVRRQYICSSGSVVKCCWYLLLKNHSLID